jgi:hypothetical protein
MCRIEEDTTAVECKNAKERFGFPSWDMQVFDIGRKRESTVGIELQGRVSLLDCRKE